MKSIFISYAREDRDHAGDLAEALNEKGYKVWWDWNLVGGHNFRDAIKRELELAEKVIVIWSEASTASSFVIDEASTARKRGKLVPLSLDGAEPPFGFGDLHTLPLSSEDMDTIVAALEGEAPRMTATKWYRRIKPRHAVLPLVGTAVALSAAALMPKSDPRCKAYAEAAVAQYKQMMATSKCTLAASPRWHDDYDNHYGWCLTAEQTWVARENDARAGHLASCRR